MKKTAIPLVLCMGLFAWGSAYGCEGTIYSANLQCIVNGQMVPVQPKYQPGFDMNFDRPNNAFIISVNGGVLYTIDLRDAMTKNIQFSNSCGDTVSMSIHSSVLPKRITVEETQNGRSITVWDSADNPTIVTDYKANAKFIYDRTSNNNSYQATAAILGTGINGGGAGSGGSGSGSSGNTGIGGSGSGSSGNTGIGGSGSGSSGNTGIGGSGSGSSGMGSGSGSGMGSGSGNGGQSQCSQYVSNPVYGFLGNTPMMQGGSLSLPNGTQWTLFIGYFNDPALSELHAVDLTATLEGAGNVTIAPENQATYTVDSKSPLKVSINGAQKVCGQTIDSSNYTEWGVQGIMEGHCDGPCKLTLQATTAGGKVMQPFVGNVK